MERIRPELNSQHVEHSFIVSWIIVQTTQMKLHHTMEITMAIICMLLVGYCVFVNLSKHRITVTSLLYCRCTVQMDLHTLETQGQFFLTIECGEVIT